jgi:prolyl-tRNA editing enzyme YbaK/EbsC (Cys-tRNA(Pro) deacylase)
VVVPAAGDTHHAIRIATERLLRLVDAEWVDVAQDAAEADRTGPRSLE